MIQLAYFFISRVNCGIIVTPHSIKEKKNSMNVHAQVGVADV